MPVSRVARRTGSSAGVLACVRVRVRGACSLGFGRPGAMRREGAAPGPDLVERSARHGVEHPSSGVSAPAGWLHGGSSAVFSRAGGVVRGPPKEGYLLTKDVFVILLMILSVAIVHLQVRLDSPKVT